MTNLEFVFQVMCLNTEKEVAVTKESVKEGKGSTDLSIFNN